MSDRLQGRRIAFLEAFNAKIVEEFAEGVHEGQRPEQSSAAA